MHPPPAPERDLAAAFQGVFGSRPPIVETRSLPGGAETLAAVPVMLTPIGDGRYALIVREANGMLAHAAVGAATVAYVERAPVARHPDRWRKIGLWPEIALNGDTGGESLKLEVRRNLGSRPLLFVSGQTIFTGDLSDDAIVIRLDVDKPVPIGRVSLASSNEDAIFDNRWARHSYRGRVVPSKPPALFAIRFEGQRAAAGSGVQRPFRGTVRYALRSGCLVAIDPLPAPEISVSNSAASDCAAASAASVPGPPRAGTAVRTGRAPGVTG